MICVNCGKLLKSGAAFCRYCGVKVVQPQGEQEKKPETNNDTAKPVIAESSPNVNAFKAENNTANVDLNKTEAPQQVNYGQMQGQQNSFAPQNNFQQEYKQPNNYAAQNNYQQLYNSANENPPKARVNKKPLIVAISVIACLAIVGTVLFLVFGKSESQKILSAFQKTLTAESFSVSGSAYSDGYGFDFNGEILGDDKHSLIYLNVNDDEDDGGEFAFCDGQMYTKYYDYYDELCFDQYEDKETSEILTKICQRDFLEAAKTNKSFERSMKENFARNYDEVPQILMNMLNDAFKQKGNVSFIESMTKKDNRYTFIIDLEKFVKAAKKDYGLKLNNELYDDIRGVDCTVEISFKIERGYVTAITFEAETYDEAVEASVAISDINKIDSEKSNAVLIAEEAAAYLTSTGVSKSKIRSANANAKTAYNAAAVAWTDLEVGGYLINWDDLDPSWKSVEDVPSAQFPSSQNKSELQAYVEAQVAQALRDHGDGKGMFLIVSYDDYFRIYYRSDYDDRAIGSYPEPTKTTDEAKELYDRLKNY